MIFKGRNEASPVPKSPRPSQVTYIPLSELLKDEPEKAEEPKERHHSFKWLKVSGLVLASFAVVLASAYGVMTYYYSNRFFEGTLINGIDVSGQTAFEVEQAIASRMEDYALNVSARNTEDQVIKGSEIGYQYTPDGEVLSLLKSQKPYQWIRGYFEKSEYATQMKATYDKQLLEAKMRTLNLAKEETQVAASNAYVTYQNDQFEIVPETEGSEIILKEAYKAVNAAISGDQEHIDLASDPDVYMSAEVTRDDPALIETVEAYNNMANTRITYTFGDETVVLDGDTIKSWLTFDEKGELVQDDWSFRQRVWEFVENLAAQYNTVGTSRPFYTTSGRTVWVYGYAYGWLIDEESEVEQLMYDISRGARITREPIYAMTANSHGYNDFGSTYIEVDLGWQHMYYYQNGYIIFDSDIVSGDISKSGRATPEGVYTLYYKKSPAILIGDTNPETGKPEYETEVTYWMPFNGGIGFHDATWQEYFGGDRYTYAGSHGCINLPYYAAANLYDIIQYGVPIICFY